MKSKIRVAVFGVGNCCKALVEGVSFYSQPKESQGLSFPDIGGYEAEAIEFVLAYDVDKRKVGLPLYQAIAAPPNCSTNLIQWVPSKECGDTIVQRGNLLDGVAPHMRGEQEDTTSFFVNSRQKDATGDEIVEQLKEKEVQVALLYLPVGSEEATKFYVECCLEASVPFVNCIPVFIVSNSCYTDRIRAAGIPAIGDDMRSQIGASILSQVLQEMMLDRGANILFHCQTNLGGNTDFKNMLDQGRLASKKKSKENVITSQKELRGLVNPPDSVFAGPASYVPYLKDNKIAHIRIEAEGFGNARLTLDCKLSVQDSPNSAGIVIDAIRFLQVAKELGIVGPLIGPSAFTQKTPPVQMPYGDALTACRQLADRIIPTAHMGLSQKTGSPLQGL